MTTGTTVVGARVFDGQQVQGWNSVRFVGGLVNVCAAHDIAHDVRDRAAARCYQDLAVWWFHVDPGGSHGLIERRHCDECQPHDRVSTVSCVR